MRSSLTILAPVRKKRKLKWIKLTPIMARGKYPRALFTWSTHEQ